MLVKSAKGVLHVLSFLKAAMNCMIKDLETQEGLEEQHMNDDETINDQGHINVLYSAFNLPCQKRNPVVFTNSGVFLRVLTLISCVKWVLHLMLRET